MESLDAHAPLNTQNNIAINKKEKVAVVTTVKVVKGNPAAVDKNTTKEISEPSSVECKKTPAASRSYYR